MTLNELIPGQIGKVIKLSGKGPLKRRIIDMGIIPGAIITMKRIAPLGDPIEISIRGYELSIRKSDAQSIEIVRIIDSQKQKIHPIERFHWPRGHRK